MQYWAIEGTEDPLLMRDLQTHETLGAQSTEKPGCSWRGKVHSAAGLAIVQIVVSKRVLAHTAIE